MMFTNQCNHCCRKRGIVVNISSTSALNPTPLLGVYAASKVDNRSHDTMFAISDVCVVRFL